MSTIATRPSGGFDRNRAEQDVVGAVVDVRDEVGTEDDQRDGDDGGRQAAEQHEAPALGAARAELLPRPGRVVTGW